jgi:hypothetical protein
MVSALEEPKASKVILGPSNVRNHGLQRSYGKRVAKMVIGYNRSPFIVVAIDVVAAAGARQAKSIRVQCANQLPRGNATR